MRLLASFTFAVLLGAIALPAFADTDIDVVYGDEIAKRGEVAAELAARWSQTARESEFAGRNRWQAVGELAYGFTDNVSLGVKLPVSRVDGKWYGHGAYAEATYVAPHRADGFYWGFEVEAGSIKEIRQDRAFVLEVFPIMGYRAGRFHLSANPSVEYVSKGVEQGWEFAPKAKLSYSLNDAHALGLEYHAGGDRRGDTAYLTWDAKIHGQRMSLALGHGTGHGSTHGADRWAIRIGIELDD
jgi:hypothetical protein